MKNNELSILIIDDDKFILEYIYDLLKTVGYMPYTIDNPLEAFEVFKNRQFSCVLSDIKMQGISGIELLKKIHSLDPDIPVLLMTGYAEIDTAVKAMQEGAFDFVIKPFSSEYLLNCIKKAFRHYKALEAEKSYKYLLENSVRSKTEELSKALTELTILNKEIIQRLATVAEFRDTDSAIHFSRISLFANKIAEAMALEKDFIEDLTLASKLHDIGKIAIPDSILLKPTSLTNDEWEIMKTHTTIGSKILSGSPHKTLQIAASIALNHHERCDGSGYPQGLKGKDIPIEGRIIIICDQYDALRSKRHYKKSLSHKEALKIIIEGDGRTIPEHFDPDVLSAFKKVADVFNDIFEMHQD